MLKEQKIYKQSTAQLNGALTCASTAQLNGALTCASTAQFNGTLTAADTSTLSTTNINGALTAANTASFTTAIPTCSASYSGVLANDSSTKIPTTAWVQTALATITPVPVTQPTLFTYQYSGTYTPDIPASTVSISVLLIGNGGQRGQTGYGVNTTGLGGTGGAGGYCYFPRLTTTKNITINFTNVGAAQLLISGLGVANNVYAEATAGGNGGNSGNSISKSLVGKPKDVAARVAVLQAATPANTHLPELPCFLRRHGVRELVHAYVVAKHALEDRRLLHRRNAAGAGAPF